MSIIENLLEDAQLFHVREKHDQRLDQLRKEVKAEKTRLEKEVKEAIVRAGLPVVGDRFKCEDGKIWKIEEYSTYWDATYGYIAEGEYYKYHVSLDDLTDGNYYNDRTLRIQYAIVLDYESGDFTPTKHYDAIDLVRLFTPAKDEEKNPDKKTQLGGLILQKEESGYRYHQQYYFAGTVDGMWLRLKIDSYELTNLQELTNSSTHKIFLFRQSNGGYNLKQGNKLIAKRVEVLKRFNSQEDVTDYMLAQ